MRRMYQVAASALRHVDSNNAGRSGDADVGQERIACRADHCRAVSAALR
jgi:hypothetical protein